MQKATASAGKGVVGSSLATGLSLATVSGVSAVVGVVVAREFGRGADTDGLFAAFGLFVVLSLAATSLRVVTLPALARARDAEALFAEVSGWSATLAALAAPLLVLTLLAPTWLAERLTGGLPEAATSTAAQALVWMVPAAVIHLYAGLWASALAALDDYRTAALAYGAGSVSGLALILWRVEADGLEVIAWGMFLNACVSFAIPAASFALRQPLRGGRPAPFAARARLVELGRGVGVPLLLQALYVVCLRVAAEVGVGAVTSFSYAFLAASAFVAVTAGAIALVSSVPLTRAGLRADVAARHIVATSWIALACVGGAAGLAVVVGGPVAELLLGGSYGGEVGENLGRLVAYLSPWMVASVGVSVSFPLLFVRGRPSRVLRPALAVAVLHGGVALALRELFGLAGVAGALALSTALVLAVVLAALGVLRTVAWGLLGAAAAVALVTGLAFAPALVLPSAVAGAVGVVLYAALLLLLRPPGLTESWAYMRALR